ncbi:mCG147421, partial [Mus musculus]
MNLHCRTQANIFGFLPITIPLGIRLQVYFYNILCLQKFPHSPLRKPSNVLNKSLASIY